MCSTRKESKLHFTLDQSSGVPFYRQIVFRVEHEISLGILQSGDKLPTIRSLAIQLKMNPNTIAKAYAELELKKIVTTQVGSGTFVSTKQPIKDILDREEKIQVILAQSFQSLMALGISKSEIITLVTQFLEEKKDENNT